MKTTLNLQDIAGNVTGNGIIRQKTEGLDTVPGDNCNGDSFQLPEHVSLNLTAKQSADRIADHFSSISQEFEPFNLDHMHVEIRE